MSLETRQEPRLTSRFRPFCAVAGRVDNETATMMQLPRCGVKDKVGYGLEARRRRRRYTLQGSKWASTELSYRISKYPRRFKDRNAVDKEIARAFKVAAPPLPASSCFGFLI